MKHASAITKVNIKSAHDSGMSIVEISRIFGYHRTTISRWLKDAETDPEFKTPRKTGSGSEPSLSERSINILIRAIKKPASVYGYKEGFWTLRRVQEVCLRLLKVKLSTSTIFRILKKKDIHIRNRKSNIMRRH